MNYLDLLNNSLQEARVWQEKDMTPLCFLSEHIFNFTTYDNEMSIMLGTTALEVCVAISERKNFEYMEQGDDKYALYLIMCNMPFFEDKLDWGSSIRGAWWDIHGDSKFKLTSCGLFDGDEQIIKPLEFNKEEWGLFIKAMVEFTQVKKVTT